MKKSELRQLIREVINDIKKDDIIEVVHRNEVLKVYDDIVDHAASLYNNITDTDDKIELNRLLKSKLFLDVFNKAQKIRKR